MLSVLLQELDWDTGVIFSETRLGELHFEIG